MNEPGITNVLVRMDDPPEQNVHCFKLMYAIENAIRELIIETLSKLYGPLWYKHRLPSDVLQKYREGIELQRHTKWINLVPHHPIYYVDFPDLRKIIERQDNWKDAFSTIFARKEVLSATLSELEAPRNALAHNRKLGEYELVMLQAALCKLVSAVGDERFRRLASLTSTACAIRDTLINLRSDLAAHLRICASCHELESMETWNLIRKQWWFDETYLGYSTDPLEKCFDLFTQYSQLPRHRRSGHILEKWVKTSKLTEMVTSAAHCLSQLIDTTN